MGKSKPFISVIIYFGLMIYLELIFNKLVSADNILMYSIVNILKYLILIGVFYLLNKKEINMMFKDEKKNGIKYLKQTLPIWIIGFCLMMLSNYLINNATSIPTNEELLRVEFQKYMISSIIISGFLAPILEELVFRLSFNTINNKYLFIIITTILFASIHISSMNEILYLIPYSILGLIFGLSYIKTNNIFASIKIHVIHNLVVMLLLFIL